MKFDKKLRGYDPAQVDRYLQELDKNAEREMDIRIAQKERIDQLTEENRVLTEQLNKYKENEQAISQALVASQHLAQKLKFDAEKYSAVVLRRAKIFYATWRAYSQTIISSLLPEEVEEFNKLQRKIEQVINAYEGRDIEAEIAEGHYDVNGTGVGVSAAAANAQPTTTNPITRVEQAAEQVIDLNELNCADVSLDDICAELGLIDKKPTE